MKSMLTRTLRLMLLLLLVSLMIPRVEGSPTRGCTCGAEGQMPLVMLSDAPGVLDTDDNFQRWRFGWPLQVVHLYVARPYDETVCRLRLAPLALLADAALCSALALSFVWLREWKRRRTVCFMYGNTRY